MRITLGDEIEVFADCIRPLGESMLFTQGWICWPTGRPMPLVRPTDGGQPLDTTLVLPHRRPDIALPAHGGRTAAGLIMLCDAPRGEFAFTSGDGAAEAAISAIPYGPDIDTMLGQSHWTIVFELLATVVGRPDLHGMLAGSREPLGVFSRWHAALPQLDPAARNALGLERIEALIAPSGECAFCVSLPEPLPPEARLRLLVRTPGGGGASIQAPEGIAELRGERDITLYGRVELEEPGAPAEFIVELSDPAGSHWFRTQPRPMSAPHFLRALTTIAGGDLAERFTWLRGLLDDREASFAERCRPAEATPRPGAPIVALLEAVADPFMARIAALAAREIERHAAELVVFGPREAADAVADIFLQRGRIPVRTGFDLVAAVRRATYARASLVLIEAEALAEALLDHRVGTLFAHPFHGGALGRLRSLSAIAGTMDGTDALGRLAAAAAGRSLPTSTRRMRAAGAFAPLIDAHLAALWRQAAPDFAGEAAHGRG